MEKHRKFDKLGLFYILALSGIALSIIISQVVIQSYISKQQNDARAINVAGRQRMLSQKISKLALQIVHNQEDTASINELKMAVNLWKKSHQALLRGDDEIGINGHPSDIIKRMYDQIAPHFNQIVTSAEAITSSRGGNIEKEINTILEHESDFLTGMDKIVFQYDNEANNKVAQLRKVEVFLLVISLSIIGIELIFIFRPLAKNVRATVNGLIESEERSLRMASEMSRLYEELVKSYQELEALDYELDMPVLFATMDKKGNFISLTRDFKDVMEYGYNEAPGSFGALLEANNYSKEFIKGLLSLLVEDKSWNGEVKLVSKGGDFCWLQFYIIPVAFDGKRSFKVIGRDITALKEAKMRSNEINREKVEKRVREQQYRSVLILEGQEEERKRLGMEIHDGVGQMLTALKLSLESITPSSSVHTKKRLEDTKGLMKSIIKEMRRISFNLIPTSLSDFGIVPAIRKFCQQVNEISNGDVIFENKTRFVNRLDNHIENNLYRIIQEAVNNAIKYAKAKRIKVSFEHTVKVLTIVIQDNGKGFDYEKLKKSDYFRASGHGIFNMKERTVFIGGKFEVQSQIGTGTKITIILPLE